jgi:hypothetical protein
MEKRLLVTQESGSSILPGTATMVIQDAAWVERQRAYKRKANVKRRKRNKQTVLDHYGNACNCCGESRSVFLCVDHVANDGAAHRKVIGTGHRKIGSGHTIHT